MFSLNDFSFFDTVSEIKFNSQEDFNKATNITAVTDKCYDESPSSGVLMVDNNELPIVAELLESNNIDFNIICLQG